MKVIGIDPGNEQSAYAFYDSDANNVIDFGLVPNSTLEALIGLGAFSTADLIGLEMIACYGMAVGKTVFDTVLEIGRLTVLLPFKSGTEYRLVYRSAIKMHFCHAMNAKDGNVAQVLRDRFGEKGTKRNPGFFYGFKRDIWQAFAVAIYTYDTALQEDSRCD